MTRSLAPLAERKPRLGARIRPSRGDGPGLYCTAQRSLTPDPCPSLTSADSGFRLLTFALRPAVHGHPARRVPAALWPACSGLPPPPKRLPLPPAREGARFVFRSRPPGSEAVSWAAGLGTLLTVFAKGCNGARKGSRDGVLGRRASSAPGRRTVLSRLQTPKSSALLAFLCPALKTSRTWGVWLHPAAASAGRVLGLCSSNAASRRASKSPSCPAAPHIF